MVREERHFSVGFTPTAPKKTNQMGSIPQRNINEQGGGGLKKKNMRCDMVGGDDCHADGVEETGRQKRVVKQIFGIGTGKRMGW